MAQNEMQGEQEQRSRARGPEPVEKAHGAPLIVSSAPTFTLGEIQRAEPA